MSVNRRSIEIDDYLIAVQDWKNTHRYPFQSLKIGVLSLQNDTFPLTIVQQEVMSEQEVRLALNLAYEISDGSVIDKPLNKDWMKQQHLYE